MEGIQKIVNPRASANQNVNRVQMHMIEMMYVDFGSEFPS